MGVHCSKHCDMHLNEDPLNNSVQQPSGVKVVRKRCPMSVDPSVQRIMYNETGCERQRHETRVLRKYI